MMLACYTQRTFSVCCAMHSYNIIYRQSSLCPGCGRGHIATFRPAFILYSVDRLDSPNECSCVSPILVSLQTQQVVAFVGLYPSAKRDEIESCSVLCTLIHYPLKALFKLVDEQVVCVHRSAKSDDI
jgi:hypothetical protein